MALNGECHKLPTALSSTAWGTNVSRAMITKNSAVTRKELTIAVRRLALGKQDNSKIPDALKVPTAIADKSNHTSAGEEQNFTKWLQNHRMASPRSILRIPLSGKRALIIHDITTTATCAKHKVARIYVYNRLLFIRM